jgi:hypothetical protein
MQYSYHKWGHNNEKVTGKRKWEGQKQTEETKNK